MQRQHRGMVHMCGLQPGFPGWEAHQKENCVISYTQFYKAVLRIKKTPVCMHPQESVILPWQGRNGGLLNGHRPVRVRVGKGFCMPKDCMCQEMGCFKVHFVRKLWRL